MNSYQHFGNTKGQAIVLVPTLTLFSFFCLFLVSQGHFYLLLAPVILFFACWKRFSFVIAPVLILSSLFFKNLVYHLSFVLFPDSFSFDVLPILFGLDYLLMLLFGGLGLLVVFPRMTYKHVAYLALIFVYVFYGLFSIDLVSVAAYSRFYLMPVFAFVLGWLFYQYGSERYIYTFLSLIFFYLIVETLPGYYDLIDVNSYLQLKYHGRDITSVDYVHKMGMSIGDIRISRVLGPQFHPISIGYVLLFIHVALYALKPVLFYALTPFFWWFLFLSSKGAFTADLLIFALFFSFSFLTRRKAFHALIIFTYVSLLLLISTVPGLTSGYEHLQGLVGGLRNMLINPLGTGIGVGGTMSSLKGVEHGGESGVGVVLTHIGILGVLIYFYILQFLFKYLFFEDRKIRCYATYCLVVFLNGILQEEAFLASAAFLGWFMFAFSLCRLKTKGMDYKYTYDSK